MPRRVATVFGGSGFIGRHLIRRLAADGWIIRVGVRDPDAALFLKPMGDPGQIVPVPADVTDAEGVAALVHEAQLVVNLVGILYERGRTTFQRIHVEGAATVAGAAKAARCERLVHLSAIGADVDSPAQYARTKAQGERAVTEAFPEATIMRPSVVFGPEDQFLNRFAEIARFSPVLPVFPARFQPVFVGDVADAILQVLADPESRGKTYELGGPRVLSFREIMELINRETGRHRRLIRMPLRLAAAYAWFLEWLPVPPLTRDQVRLLSRDNVVAADALTLADLGVQPADIEAIAPLYVRIYARPRDRTAPQI
ncbi:MAG: complex I NDUFA9 subunit family protein [Rhodospirillales bacterium]|nr:MAG: complex I NDUFA9 subunit family protein [Rhodospirillales bacterium]